ncbi:PadR family transcriptional regulator [Ruania albidiflava]|uniref:PadR family transcriptional regulator n=1 Tax=Ruania albidiflava TaxID=366586 RepID=UPI0023EFAFC5|nr:PadR family transcriptional regulator [Ruania albidiflava]
MTISGTGSGLTTRMAILGALSFRPMHGYEIRRELELRRVDRWAGVSYGSIYGRLRSLVREKHIEVVGSEQVGNRPARTVYRITPAGADELTRAMRTALSTPQFPPQPIDLALSFCATADARLGSEELLRLLRIRAKTLATLASELAQARTEPVSSAPGVSDLVSDLFAHRRQQIETEQRWVQHVLTRLEAGAYGSPERGALDTAPHMQGTDR